MIDSHCHIDFDVFDDDRSGVLDRAWAIGITDIIVPATTRERWEKLAGICKTDQRLHACYGLHPYWTNDHDQSDLEALAARVRQEDCAGIAECGLDFRPDQPEREAQIALFDGQLAIAAETRLPIAIHAVNATEEVIRLLRSHPGVYGKMHSYSGSHEQAKRLIDMGFYISFGGTITYDFATRQRETASKLPLESIMIESNAPDQPGAAHRDLRNEPAFLTEVLDTLVLLRKEEKGTVADRISENTRSLFRL